MVKEKVVKWKKINIPLFMYPKIRILRDKDYDNSKRLKKWLS